ncbi:hypothetical protein AKO1_004992 [Acrasis kona]|uniref:Uncharacterized protein n=1 Tax=Acrasis kona TaxID=1008807 RepID=A0AAW2Z541_9EUKA
MENKWKTPLCDCSDPDVSCYTLTSCPCALATGLTDLEGSEPRYEEWCCWLFTTLTCPCIMAPYARYRAREGYDIKGTVANDLCVGLCCSYCSTRQIWSEVKVRGTLPKKKGFMQMK